MSHRQKALQKILRATDQIQIPQLELHEILQSKWADEVTAVYSRLGGKGYSIPVNPRPTLGIGLGDVVVKLDPELHFNRYRAQTLQSCVYKSLPKFPKRNYVEYCKSREAECLRAGGYGGKWTNPSADRQFGESSLSEVHEAQGPSRWKQRAFYEFQKDIATVVTGRPVVRIAIWDVIAVSGRRVSVSDALRQPRQKFYKPLRELIESRVP